MEEQKTTLLQKIGKKKKIVTDYVELKPCEKLCKRRCNCYFRSCRVH